MKIKIIGFFVAFQLFFNINVLHSVNSNELYKENKSSGNIESEIFHRYSLNFSSLDQTKPDSSKANFTGMSGLEVSPSSIFVALPPDSSLIKNITISNNSLTALNFNIENIETSKRIKFESMTKEVNKDSQDDLLNFVKYQIKNGSSKAKNVSWMEKNTNKGFLQPGESIDIELSLSSSELPDDVYNAKLLISSSNPDVIDVLIPLTFLVSKSNCPYLVTEDNENNAYQGIPDYDMDINLTRYDAIAPIEFNFFIDETNISSAMLNIYAFDVDETASPPPPEIDEVYINGNLLGILSGADNVWSSTSFEVNPNFLTPGPNGKNTVRIEINTDPSGVNWVVAVDWGQLIINNCQGGDAHIRTVDLDKTVYLPGDPITITSETDTELATQSVHVETNLLDDQLNNVGGVTNTITINGVEDEPLPVNFTIPGSAILGTEYKAQVIVYDANTYLFQDMVTLPVPIGNMAIEVSPLLLNVSLCEGESINETITISNTGDGDINFTISDNSSWLSENPLSGAIVPGDNESVQITIDAAGLSSGFHNGEVYVNSNVLSSPQIIVPVSLEVIPPMASYSTVTSGDNENNQLTGTADNDINSYLCKGDAKLPVEFNFFIDQNTIESAELIIETFDVDQAGGCGLCYTEVNKVYFNGTMVGILTGDNQGVSFTTLTVPPSIINPGANGKNLVQIYVSVLGKYWCTNVQSAELRIYNCSNK